MAKRVKESKQKEDSVNVDIPVGQIVEFSDIPSALEPIPRIKAVGKVLRKDTNIITAAFCIKKRDDMTYTESSSIFIQYAEFKENYMFYANINSIRLLRESDDFNIDEMLSVIEKEFAYEMYIMTLIPTSSVLRFQRRQYYRSILEVDVYYMPIEEEAQHSDTRMLFTKQERIEEKLKIDEGYYEEELGYKKLKTIDISAGGFRFFSDEKYDIYTNFDCMLILDDEAVPIIVQVLACSMSHDFIGKYNIRCCYADTSEAIRDRIMKYIFDQERQLRRRYVDIGRNMIRT